MKKTCKQCHHTYEYETEEEHRKFFYKKGSYFQCVCIECTKSTVRQEQKPGGKYDYRGRDKFAGGIPEGIIGNLHRC